MIAVSPINEKPHIMVERQKVFLLGDKGIHPVSLAVYFGRRVTAALHFLSPSTAYNAVLEGLL